MSSIIIGTGSCVPEKVVSNSDFLNHQFYKKDGTPVLKANDAIIEKMESISGIRERRYVPDEQDTIYISTKAAEHALESANISGEQLDGIIVAHNFGNLEAGSSQPHLVPNLGAHVKNRLAIKNHRCIAFDVLFGCPGWVQAMIQAHQIIKAGDANNILVIGVDVLSRVLDPHDMDVMLFGDGAGAAILQKSTSQNGQGIIYYDTVSHCGNELNYIYMGQQNDPVGDDFRIKMAGRYVYKYAVGILPGLVTECVEKAGYKFSDVSKFLFHQANEKMNIAIGKRLSEMHDEDLDENKFPMTIQCLGNTSAATVPTLLDLMMKGEVKNQQIEKGDLVVLASVGAGMHANCIVYRF